MVTNQLEFSVLHTGPLYDGTFDQCLRLRVSPMAWSPLAGGQVLKANDERARVCGRRWRRPGRIWEGPRSSKWRWPGHWRIRRELFTVLGTTNRERVRSSAAAAGMALSRDQWFFILEASAGEPAP